MISLCSCSDNGNDIYYDILPWYYIPRWADRLDAIGKNGIRRCYEYTISSKKPLFTERTPRITILKDLENVASSERFESYKNGRKSESMIDHFYDKLLHQKIRTGLPRLDAKFAKKHQEMVKFVLQFGKTGIIKH